MQHFENNAYLLNSPNKGGNGCFFTFKLHKSLKGNLAALEVPGIFYRLSQKCLGVSAGIPLQDLDFTVQILSYETLQ